MDALLYKEAIDLLWTGGRADQWRASATLTAGPPTMPLKTIMQMGTFPGDFPRKGRARGRESGGTRSVGGAALRTSGRLSLAWRDG